MDEKGLKKIDWSERKAGRIGTFRPVAKIEGEFFQIGEDTTDLNEAWKRCAGFDFATGRKRESQFNIFDSAGKGHIAEFY